MGKPAVSPETFSTFGDLLKYLRKREELTQRELAILVGYSDTQISRLEQSQRVPDAATLKALFVPALHLDHEPQWVERLLELAKQARLGELPEAGKMATPNNLPASLTTFIGREKEQAEILQLISTHRLVTLTGSGGVGKTRTSLKVGGQILEEYANGVWLVELAPLSNPELVAQTVASVFGIGIKSATTSYTQLLINFLRPKTALLILDNCEHLLDASAQIADPLLKHCPQLKILATSREALGILGEIVYPMPSLRLPDIGQTLETFREYESVRLFEERAQLAQPDFQLTLENAFSLAQICSRLDGIPLAIELAAARVNLFSTAQIAARLDDRFHLLTGGSRTALPRQQTLRASIDWSWNLLSDPERMLLRRLSVFTGGWTLEAAESVCSAAKYPKGEGDIESNQVSELMTQLVAKSLVIADRQPGRERRFHLHETIHQFASEKLMDMGIEIKESALEKHHAYFMDLITSHADALQGMQPQRAVKLIQLDLDNVRHAWQWGVANGRLRTLHQSVKALSDFCETVGLPDEGERLLAGALSLAEKPSDLPSSERLLLQIDLLLGEAGLLIHQAKLEGALERAEKALALAEKLKDPSRIGRAYLLSGQALARQSAVHKSRTYLEAGLVQARQTGDLPLEGELLRYLGTVLQDLGERQQGDTYLQQALQIMRRFGKRSQEQAILLYLGVSAIESLDYVTGRMYLEEALQLIQSTGNRPLESRIQNAIGFVNAALGELETALFYHERSRQISHEIGDPYQTSHACHNLCTVNRKLGRLELAEQWGQEALRLGQQYDLADPTAYAWLHLGYVFCERGKLSQAEDAFIRSRDGWLALGRSGLAMEAVAGLAGTKWKQGEKMEALSSVEEVIDYLANHPLEGVDEPIGIYLTCYHVLQSCGDDRAEDVLGRAHDRLMANAEKVIDPAIRGTFLGRVPAHRELIQLWELHTR